MLFSLFNSNATASASDVSSSTQGKLTVVWWQPDPALVWQLQQVVHR